MGSGSLTENDAGKSFPATENPAEKAFLQRSILPETERAHSRFVHGYRKKYAAAALRIASAEYMRNDSCLMRSSISFS
jgi:hypothetical protein